ncbi:MAG TPA: heme ABC transporter ATP-binding protein [Candidatus Fraserbacteria bacterium]|nr:heme ABC transporter ATP-binding protein [Candidatus Fraserbacteria bacterium]
MNDNIAIESLSFAYNGQRVLRDIDLEVKPGELLALIGPNGSGKTTLLRQISGALRPARGAVYLDGQEVARLKPAELARRLAALEQEQSVGFDYTVRELVSLGRIPHRGRLSRWRPEDESAVERALKSTGLQELARRSLQQLSGGERRRVFLAMALAQEPQVLLLDEPTAHLDLKYQLELLGLVRGLVARGLTVIAAFHDLNLAARYSDRVAALSGGRLVALGSPRAVLTADLIGSIWGVQVQVLEDQENFWIIPRSGDSGRLLVSS